MFTDGWTFYKVVYIHNGILVNDKNGNPVTSHKMDESWRHYAKWNKSDREKQILHDLTSMWNLEKPGS